MEILKKYEGFLFGRRNEPLEKTDKPIYDPVDLLFSKFGPIIDKMKITRDDIEKLRKYFQNIELRDNNDYMSLNLYRRAGNFTDVFSDYIAYFIPENDYVAGAYKSINNDDRVKFHKKRFDNVQDAIEWLCDEADENKIKEREKRKFREELRKTDEYGKSYGGGEIPKKVAGRYYNTSMPKRIGRNIQESKRYEKLKFLEKIKNKY